MKKRVLLFLLAVTLLSALMLFSCGGTVTTQPSTSANPIATDPNHKHNYTQFETPPTCTEEGYTIFMCACGDSYKFGFVDPTGHSFGSWEVIKAATSNETGLRERVCKCGEKETEVIPIVQDEFEYGLTESGDAYEVIGIGNVKDENLVIPSEHNGLPVIGIADNAFSRSSAIIRTVVLPNTMQYIGYCAFEKCIWLESISIPDSVADIGVKAFFGCARLKEFVVPKSLTELNALFGQCTSLESVTLHSNIVFIEGGCFKECESLRSIDLISKIAEIQDEMFLGCKMLEDVVLPDSVTYIGVKAFSGCEGLKNINVPASLSGFGSDAFYGCASLKSFAIPSGVTEIPDSVFSGCSSLSGTWMIPSTVTKIGKNAFSGCSKIERIVFEESSQLTTIDEKAFSGCTSLKSISIGDAELVDGKFVLPSKVEKLMEYAFLNCTSMSSIVIPASTNYIDRLVFSGCSGLESAHFVKTSDWHRENWRSPNDIGSSYISVSSDVIGNSELMADYLTGTYCDKRWSNYQ